MKSKKIISFGVISILSVLIILTIFLYTRGKTSKTNAKEHSIESNIFLVKDSKKNYESGLSLYNEKKYSEAMICFDRVAPSSPYHTDAQSHKNNCSSFINSTVFNEVDKLVSKKHYSEAITYLESNLDELNHNSVAMEKLNEISKLRMDYLADYSKKSIEKETSRTKPLVAYYNKLNKDTINDFDISSNSNHLVFVNISEQKTYIFKGSNKNWTLEKDFSCSTGIEGQETPVGVFYVQAREPWFFAPKYGQGGKYYVQFMGNYLFHTVPFANDQKTIVDPTLGKPASHGCIRLAVEDCKWLYDNVQNGSKIIIY